MNKIDTTVLIKALERHPALAPLLPLHLNAPEFNPKTFSDLLIKTDPHASSRGRRFYVELPDTPNLVLTIGINENEYSRLSLRRILRVKNVNEGYRHNLGKVIKGVVLHHYGFFDSTDITRRLRAYPGMNFELRENSWPYALLAKLVTRANSANLDAPLVTRTMPIFILPGALNSRAIASWELDNAIYRRHDRLIAGFPVPKVITEAQYLKLGGTPLETQVAKH